MIKSKQFRDSGIALAQTPPDPLFHFAPLPYSGIFYPYGFPVRLRTNSQAVMDAAEVSFGLFEEEFPGAPLDVAVHVSSEEGKPFPPPPVVRSHQHLLSVASDAAHFGVIDFAAGYSVVWVSPRVLEDPEFFRYYFLDTACYSIVSERYLTSIHAATVGLEGRGILLCGESGAGKSSLAYACARKGWTYASDDASFLVRSRGDLVMVGNCHRIRFRPAAVSLFPELRSWLVRPRPNGKLTIEVATNDLGFVSRAPRMLLECVVFLNRQRGANAEVRPYPKDEAMRRFEGVLYFGRESSHREQRASMRRLLSLEVAELVYEDLDDAVECLHGLLVGRYAT